jgi:hypothetical protein
MIAWGSMPANDSTSGLVTLLGRPEWAASDPGEMIKSALRPLLDHPDETIRMLVTPALAAFAADFTDLKAQLTKRLAEEDALGVRSRLMQTLGGLPAPEIDEILRELSTADTWRVLSIDPEPADTVMEAENNDLDDFVLCLLIRLDLIHRQPFAAGLLNSWMSHPLDHPKRASRTCTWLRDYLTLERVRSARAFALLAAPIPVLTEAWHEAVAHTEAVGLHDEVRQLLTSNAVKVGDSVARELYFASGAQKYDSDTTHPATKDFAEQAFPVLDGLAAISHPAVVQYTVDTLTHLIDHDRQRAFLTIARAATPPQGYQWERQGADSIIKIIDLYAADHRDLLIADPQCLTALRGLLENFVRSGWDHAIERAQGINELLR